ncbi:MAG TPA: hypothetical protein PL190_03580 [Caldisericia bacterium]|jgi:hypothetical protein|nr:MAG: hypothetical protein BWX90_00960 [bacterium ADurb.Bin132]HNY61041.1 hypothetical protein [Caldisericia bacterium]HOC78974.1 hypothetical protein [Caldisericia bacterium]HOG69761.1 hypothetical protein [Caldisericia bacterium]HPA65593.1 hypothetical protein [Caldisericia bacterium]
MTRWTLIVASLLMMAGGILMMVIKDTNGHPIGVPSQIAPVVGWIVIILGFLFLMLSMIRSE